VVNLSRARWEGLSGRIICVQVSGGRAEVLVGWLPTNTFYCPLAHPNPMPCQVQTAKRHRQTTTRRGWSCAMILCGAVPFRKQFVAGVFCIMLFVKFCRQVRQSALYKQVVKAKPSPAPKGGPPCCSVPVPSTRWAASGASPPLKASCVCLYQDKLTHAHVRTCAT
jgi:hypothetical protein